MSRELQHNYIYHFNFRQLTNLAIGFGLIGFSIFMAFRFELDNTLIAVICVSSFIGLTPLLLTLNYLTRSLGVSIKIDTNNDTFEVINRGKMKVYKLNDIQSLEIVEQKSIGLYGFDFDFAKYKFSDSRTCIVTNHMSDEYFIPIGIQPDIKKYILPIIWKRTDI